MFPLKKRRRFHALLSISALVLFPACARIEPLPPGQPFTREKTAELISGLRKKARILTDFQGLGKLTLIRTLSETEENLFAVGASPLRMRLEISHPWGKPLFHIVADEKNLSVLSLLEKRLILVSPEPGAARPPVLFQLGLDSAWKILSGLAPVLHHKKAVSFKPNEIEIYNAKGKKIQRICFHGNPPVPRSVYFPGKHIVLTFSDYKRFPQGLFSRNITVKDRLNKRTLNIRYKDLKLNRAVPEEVFRIHIPEGFKVVRMEPGEFDLLKPGRGKTP